MTRYWDIANDPETWATVNVNTQQKSSFVGLDDVKTLEHPEPPQNAGSVTSSAAKPTQARSEINQTETSFWERQLNKLLGRQKLSQDSPSTSDANHNLTSADNHRSPTMSTNTALTSSTTNKVDVSDADNYNIDPDILAAMRAKGRPAKTLYVNQWPKTVHCIGTLGAGGAERQLVNLLTTLGKRGHDKQTLLTIYPLEGTSNHYGELLSDQHVDLRTNNMPIREQGIEIIKQNPEIVDMIKRLPGEFNSWTLDIWVELMLMKPDIAHFWLDHPNVWGAPAALLAGVPTVILSTRNVHPSNFPYLDAPYIKDAYEWIVTCPRVNIINNSDNGGKSYANWLNRPESDFTTIVNGVDLTNLQPATEDERIAIRKELKLPKTTPIIVGAFRLSDEKQPLMFVDVLAKVRKSVTNARAVIMGEGPLEDAIKAHAKKLGVDKALHMVGRRSDVDKVMSSMDVFLHTAWLEGTPNIVLEAHQLAMPVVVTDAGGSDYATNHGESGFLVDRTDVDGLADSVVNILQNHKDWVEKAKSGPNFVAERFNIDKMVNETFAFQINAYNKVVTN